MKTGWKRFAICSDIHGDQQDRAAVTAFAAFCADYKPQHRILAGDLWDFRPIRGKADEKDRAESMQADYDAGLEFLSTYRPDVFLLGNHDAWLWRIAERATGLVRDYALRGIEDIQTKAHKLGATILPYDRRAGIYELGSLRVMHGFYCGKFAAKQHAEVYGTCAFGHTHACTEFNIPVWPHGKTAWNIGCLCRLDMEYDAARPGSLAQRHGWAYGVVHEKSGDFILHLAKEVGGRYVCNTEVQWY